LSRFQVVGPNNRKFSFKGFNFLRDVIVITVRGRKKPRYAMLPVMYRFISVEGWQNRELELAVNPIHE
jgi:hypothetical protein